MKILKSNIKFFINKMKDNNNESNLMSNENYFNSARFIIENGMIIERDINYEEKELLKAFEDKKPYHEKETIPEDRLYIFEEVYINNENFNKDLLKQKDKNFEKPLLGKKHSKSGHIIFNINKDSFIYRFDYYIKAYKANFLKYIVGVANYLYLLCNFGKEFKKYKFHMTNNKKYQGNSKYEDNKEFLKKKWKEVLVDYNENDIEGKSRQKQNKELILLIYNYGNFPNSTKEYDLFNFLESTVEMSLEKGIRVGNKIYDYYESEEFKAFKKEKKIIYYDNKFYFEKNRKFSLLEKGAFIKLVNQPSYFKKNI